MEFHNRQRLDNALTMAYILSPLAAFGVTVGAAASIYGIHKDDPPPPVHEIKLDPSTENIICLGNHALKLQMHNGQPEVMVLKNCP
jgi:hypothetical protein